MSALQLQRIVVRMLYDPAFVAQVFADPEAALQYEELTAQERSWLLATDQRSYMLDPLRPTRTLTALIEEFPVAVHQVVQCNSSHAHLHAFFRSASFHRCIQQRGSLAEAFSMYLLSEDLQPRPADPLFTQVVQLETALAQLRRRPHGRTSTVSQDILTLASTAVLLHTTAGVLTCYHANLDRLQNDPDGLVAAALKITGMHTLQETAAHEWLLAVWHAETESATLEVLPAALGSLLATAPATRQVLRNTARSLGADVEEAEDIIAGLLADGLLAYAELAPRSSCD